MDAIAAFVLIGATLGMVVSVAMLALAAIGWAKAYAACARPLPTSGAPPHEAASPPSRRSGCGAVGVAIC
jgi:hypothetical protein